jgi:hypothetical protein
VFALFFCGRNVPVDDVVPLSRKGSAVKRLDWNQWRRRGLAAILVCAIGATGSLVGAGSAAASTPLTSACSFTGADQASVSLSGGLGIGLLGNTLATVQLTNADTGDVLGNALSVNLLGGAISLNTAVALPTGTSAVGYRVVPLLSGLFAPVVGTVACTAAQTLEDVTGGYVAVPPARILDTRIGLGGTTIPAGGTLQLTVAGAGGVPALGVAAANLNVTAVNGKADGNLTVFADGQSRPGTSNVNWKVGATVANTAVVQLGQQGRIDLYNSSRGAVDVVVDLAGYYLGGVAALLPGAYQPVTPTRLFDSRTTSAVSAQQAVSVPVLGRGGVPATAVGAVVVNVTATGPTYLGHLRVYPAGTALPNVSNLNFQSGDTVANLAVVAPGSDGAISIFNGARSGTVNVVVDVVGYFRSGIVPVQTPGLMTVVQPSRLLDTRIGLGRPGTTAVPAGGTVQLQVAGRGGVPATGVRSVLVTVTSTQSAASGDVSAFPADQTRPATSVLNFLPNRDIANLTMVGLSPDGTIDLYNDSRGSVQLVVDVSAYVTAGITVG